MVEALCQRLNGDQRSMFASPPPVVIELGLTRSRPLADETPRTEWQATGEDRQILKVKHRLRLAITSMEVRAFMVGLVVIHPDRDPIKAAYLRHPGIVRFPLSQNKTCA